MLTHAPSPPLAVAASPRILVVDDDPDIRTIVALVLRRGGAWTVLQAESGAEAVQVASRELPDLVLMDMMMPDMDGPAALEALRADPATAGIPVVFLTAATRSATAQRAVEAPGVAILAKPFDPLTLSAQLLRLLDAGLA